MKKIRKLSLNEMAGRLQAVSTDELMAMVGGGTYQGVCFFDCLSSCASALGFNLDARPMIIDYGKTYYYIDKPQAAYGSDGTLTNQQYWNFTAEGILHYEERIPVIASKYFTSVSTISTGMIDTARESGCQIILTVKGDGTDHAVVYKSYDASTDTYHVWDASIDRNTSYKGSEIGSDVLCLH